MAACPRKRPRLLPGSAPGSRMGGRSRNSSICKYIRILRVLVLPASKILLESVLPHHRQGPFSEQEWPMRANPRQWRHVLEDRMRSTRFGVLAVLLAVVIVPAWSDIRPAGSGVQNKKTCYCNCDSKPNAQMCTQMCELPKYQNRSWASSCEKKPTGSPATSSPDQRSHSKKRNRVEDARL